MTTATATCTRCGRELRHWDEYERFPRGAERAAQRLVCPACHRTLEAEAAVLRSVPCLVCGELADPENPLNWLWTGRSEDRTRTVHHDCQKTLLRRAPARQIVERQWRETNWRRAELYYVLACGHVYPAASRTASSMRCRWCAIAALLGRAEEDDDE